jgi:hypothetical protein
MVTAGTLVLLVVAVYPTAAQEDLEGFQPLFDGKSLEGWRILKESSERWGKWEVVDGVIVGDQYPEGKGGLFVTTATYRDFELYAEVKADYPIDSGLFLRVQPNVLSYQVTIDYRPQGEVGAIYCPGGGGFLIHKPEGIDLWKGDDFNTVRVKISGQPAHIQVWINGTALVDYHDTLVEGKPRVPESGFIGIQVHGGASWKKGNKVYFRKLLVRPVS